jgi:UDP-2,4-diacetamido-2,4,6-trideoxy-beta-L-altropyranose hydrolase
MLGGGHIARCLALAGALAARGWHCAFAVSAETQATLPALAASGHGLVALPPGLSPALEPVHLAASHPQGCALLIVDHYARDTRFESACRPWAGRILVIDDLADRLHDCDWLVDPTLGRSPHDYRRLVPEGATQLLGPAYAWLKPEFAALRPGALARRRSAPGPRRLLIAFGGTDPHDATGACLAALSDRRATLEVDIVLGASAPHLSRVRDQIAAFPGARLHVETSEMAALMEAADIALGGAGVTSWERCCLGLPAVVAVVAGNQRAIAAVLAEAGAVRSVGEWDMSAGRRMVDALLALDTDELAALSSRAAEICDGSGIFRTAEALDPLRQGLV